MGCFNQSAHHCTTGIPAHPNPLSVPRSLLLHGTGSQALQCFGKWDPKASGPDFQAGQGHSLWNTVTLSHLNAPLGADQMSWCMGSVLGKESRARVEELQDQELQGRKGFSHLCEQSLCSQRKKFCKESEQTKGKVTYRNLGEKKQRFVRK